MRAILVLFVAAEVACIATGHMQAAAVGAASFAGSFLMGLLVARHR